MTVTEHWLAQRPDGSWTRIDSLAVAMAYRAEGVAKIAGPFVPAGQLQGAVSPSEVERLVDAIERDRREPDKVLCHLATLRRLATNARHDAGGQ